MRLILWDLAKNQFEYGQWLNGAIQDFDVSVNGEHLLYFVAYHKTRAPYLWTALSKPPYFTALAMWPISDAWGGHCAFVDTSSLYIEKGMHQSALELSAGYSLKRYVCVHERHDRDWKMKRDGWLPIVPLDHPPGHGMQQLVWRKALFSGSMNLCRQTRRGKGGALKPRYWLDGAHGTTALPDVDCADIDQRGRLIIAQRGVLKIARPAEEGDLAMEEVADFNDQVPEDVPAPRHARRW